MAVVGLKFGINVEGQGNAAKEFRVTGQAAAEASSVGQAANKAWGSTVAGVGAAYFVLKDVLGKISGTIGAVFEKTASAEKANNLLAISLATSGKAGAGAAKDLIAYAEKLSMVTGKSQDEIAQVASVNAAYGLNVEQIKAVTDASTALAQVTGQGLVESNKKLLASLTGEVGELKTLIPEVVTLTRSQLQHGEAIKLVSERLGKFSGADANTTAGALDRMELGFNKVVKSIGAAILKGADLPGFAGNATSSFSRLTQVIQDNDAALVSLGASLTSGATTAFEVFISAAIKTANYVSALKGALESIHWIQLGQDILTFGALAAAGFSLWNISAISSSILAFGQAAASLIRVLLAIRTASLAAALPMGVLVLKIAAVVAAVIGAYLFFENFQTIMIALKDISVIVGVELAKLGLWVAELTYKFIGMFKSTDAVVRGLDNVAKARAKLDGKADASKDNLKNLEFSSGVIGRTWDQISGFVGKFNAGLDDAQKKTPELVGPVQPVNLGGSTAGISVKNSKEQEAQRLAAVQQINQQIFALQSTFNDQMVTNYQTALNQISAQEKQLAKENINISKEAIRFRSEALKSFAAQATQTYSAFYLSESELAQRASELQVTQAQQAFTKGLISEQTYAETVRGIRGKLADDYASKSIDANIQVLQAQGNFVKASSLQINKIRLDYDRMIKERLITSSQAASAIELIEVQAAIANQKIILDATATYARASGNTLEIIRAESEQQIKVQEELLAKKLINEQQFAEAKKNIQSNAAEKSQQTTGSEKTDKQLSTATSLVSSAQSGLSSIISTVGSMFGPIGSLIAGVVNLLSMVPEQFQGLIKGLLKAALDFPSNLIANIPALISILIQSVPKVLINAITNAFTLFPTIVLNAITVVISELPGILDRILSPDFWIGIAKSALSALTKAFRGFWDALFTGKKMKTAIDTGASATQKATFGAGAENPNAGGSDFKVKDLQLTGERKAQDVKGQIDETVEEGGKGFFGYIQEAWQWVIDNVFKPIGDFVKPVFQWVYDTTLKPFIDLTKVMFQFVYDTVLKPAIDLFSAMWNFLKAGIFDPIVASFRAVWNFVTTIFDNPIKAFKDLWAAAKDIFAMPIKALGDLWTRLSTIGSNILDGIKNGISGVWSVFSNLGDRIVDGLKSAISGVGSFIGKLFSDPNPGKGKVENWMGVDIPFLKFADGGMVPGVAKSPGDSAANDNIPAMLSPGEVVLPRSIVQNSSYNDIIKAMTQGRPIQRYSLGSVLSSGAKAVGGAVSGAVSSAGSALKSIPGVGQVSDAISSAWSGLAGTAKEVFNWLKSIGGSIDVGKFVQNPVAEANNAFSKIIDGFFSGRVDEIMGGLFRNKFAMGGLVQGYGSSDSVPAMLTPGEYVLPRNQVENGRPAAAGGAGQTVNITINVAPNAQVSESDMRREFIPKILEALKRESQNGTLILSSRGVF